MPFGLRHSSAAWQSMACASLSQHPRRQKLRGKSSRARRLCWCSKQFSNTTQLVRLMYRQILDHCGCLLRRTSSERVIVSWKLFCLNLILFSGKLHVMIRASSRANKPKVHPRLGFRLFHVFFFLLPWRQRQPFSHVSSSPLTSISSQACRDLLSSQLHTTKINTRLVSRRHSHSKMKKNWKISY